MSGRLYKAFFLAGGGDHSSISVLGDFIFKSKKKSPSKYTHYSLKNIFTRTLVLSNIFQGAADSFSKTNFSTINFN